MKNHSRNAKKKPALARHLLLFFKEEVPTILIRRPDVNPLFLRANSQEFQRNLLTDSKN